MNLIPVLGLVLSACAPTGQAPASTTPSRLDALRGTPGQLTVALPATDLSVGANQRFLVAIIDPSNRLVTDATLELAFFKVTGPNQAQLRSRSSATYRESPGLPGRGIYVARAEFDEVGDWGVAVQIQQPNAQPTERRVSFQVKAKSSTPSPGDPAPASQTLTGQTPAEVERFCSSRPGDDFHRLSITQAVSQRKPFVVLFATPGFCSSLTCGPSLDVLKTLQTQYGAGLNFIHVEVYKDGRPNDQREMVPAIAEWGLPSEPWLFVVGADGRLVDRFEGSITVEEVGPVLVELVAS